jgi:hypothetical protein
VCEIHRKGFIQLLSDNDEVFLSHISAIIESVDEYAAMEITKAPDAFHFRLVASLPKYNKMLLEEILKLHNMFIKTSVTINFAINMNN